MSEKGMQEAVKMIIGIVSDTHMPRRGKELPGALVSGLERVDMIIHAGDITEMWVLEKLSRLAPVPPLTKEGNPGTHSGCSR